MTDTTTLIQRLQFLVRYQSTITHVDLKEAADAIEQQATEIAALRADAERWRFFLNTRPPNTHEVVRSAIDAALRQEQPT